MRVPMQWTAEPGGGFSTADPSTFPEPLAEGAFGPEHVNVRDQSRDPDSLLSFFRHLVDSYRACPELAWGTVQVVDPGPKAGPVLAHRADVDGISVVALHNFADRKVTATLPLTGLGGRRPVRRAGRRRIDGDGGRRRHAQADAAAVRLPLAALGAVIPSRGCSRLLR